MSIADDMRRDAGISPAPMSLSAQMAQDLADTSPAAPPPLAQRPQPEPLSMMDRLLAKVPDSLVNNPATAGARNIVTRAAAPIVGGAQLIANLFPESTGVPQLYNRKIGEVESADRAAQKEGTPLTSSVNEFAGSMISPANLAMGLRAAPAVTAGQRTIQGAAIGTAGGATAPVEVGESGKYWGQKGVQTAVGAAGGAVLAPVMGAIGDRVMARINSTRFNPATASKDADQIISGALQDSNQKLEDLPLERLQSLRQQVVTALSQGKNLDAAAALRAQDFKAENIKPTLGWVTRDPMQWAAEQNVRGVKGAGEPVGRLITEGNQAVTRGVGQYGNGASEAYLAAPKIADALRNYDQGKQAAVTSAYQSARQSEGKDLLIPTENILRDYKKIVSDFEDKIPKAVQSKFDRLGFQFSFEDADNLRKVINDHVGSDTTTNKALGRLRDSLNSAQLGADVAGGPYAPAVKLARERFAQQEAIPAIADAVNGKVDDKFIQRQIINNPSTPQVQKLAALLKEQAPDAFQEARQQVGAHLAQSAFGENAAGDKLVNQASYNKALRTLGTGKLEAFFEPQEVDQLKRLGRLASYQVAPPAGAASNYSNTASTIANLLRAGGGFIPVAKGPVQFAGDKIEAAAAVRPQVPVTPNLTPEQRLMMSRALTAITGGAAMALPPRVVGQ